MLAHAAGAEPSAAEALALPGTSPLTLPGDLASNLVAGADRFLLKKLAASIKNREAHWKRDLSSVEAYENSIEPNRKRLIHILGMRDARAKFERPEVLAQTGQSPALARGQGFEVFAVRWPAFADVHGEGLLLTPVDRKPLADVVAIPDADQSPEQLVGLTEGVARESQFARVLAESGCRVLVPVLIDRHLEKRNGRANLSSREFIYRSAFVLGRHLVGYEVQKVLAAVDWFQRESGDQARIGVFGYGEGGMLALYAGALDSRIDAVGVSGFFDGRQTLWQEPIDRNVFGLLDWFGNAELGSMIMPRGLVIEAARAPELELPGQGGAPARLITPVPGAVQMEVDRLKGMVQAWPAAASSVELISSADGRGPFGSLAALQPFLTRLHPEARLASGTVTPELLRPAGSNQDRQARQLHELDRHNQWVLTESPYVRQEFMKKLDTSSLPKYEESTGFYRQYFANEVIGQFEDPLLPANARTRRIYEKELWTGYEVVLDVYPDVIAHGVLLLPKDLKPGEKRPVVVCQHGLEGRPKDVIEGNQGAYHDYAAKLAERGFITFAPQNLYLFTDRFRTLQRKANPLGKTLFSIIVPQHRQIVNWLKTLPGVDEKRIAFYGLSYGGKTAMRVPALIEDYCLSICSADFNEWVWKNASSRSPYSYVWTGEYEIFEFDLGGTFNYAEMAALIAPRPFMVERGHFDGVAPDETVGYEFAKVQHLYAARLKIPERCEIEWFDGPHTIHGQGTFEFLHRHLKWPRR